MDPIARLNQALANREHIRLAHKVGAYRSAKMYLPPTESDPEDVAQEIAMYLWHLQTNTNSGWNPARGAWSTWCHHAITGLVCKWARRKHMILTEDPHAPSTGEDPTPLQPTTIDDPESMMIGAQEATAALEDPYDLTAQFEAWDLSISGKN